MRHTKKHAARTPSNARAAREPAIPPTTAPVLIAPEAAFADDVELAETEEPVAMALVTEANELECCPVAKASVTTAVDIEV